MDNSSNSQAKPRVVVAMSGGVDSSVSAALLVEQGYDVVGMMMRLWSEPSAGTNAPVNRCCTPDQMADARRVADHLGIPFYVLDAQDTFREKIVDFFISEHEAGRTPNPCIQCNRQIRFTYLLQQALAMDARFLATGHYAQIVEDNGLYRLYKGRDDNKDQSYALHALSQSQLRHAMFPVGGYTKPEVRALAAEFGLPVAVKHESQDLCFLGDGDYRRFLREHSEKVEVAGAIIDEDGRQVGDHNGLAFYTVGQRKGLGLNSPDPLFVLRKDISHNALVVGPRHRLGREELAVRDVNWISGRKPAQAIETGLKIRYRSAVVPATVWAGDDGQAVVRPLEPVQGVSAGQSAVFYDGDECLGGGILRE